MTDHMTTKELNERKEALSSNPRDDFRIVPVQHQENVALRAEIERLGRDHRATHKLLLERDREIERLRAALASIARQAYEHTAEKYRGALSELATDTQSLEYRQAVWDAMYKGDGGTGELSLQGFKIPPRPTE